MTKRKRLPPGTRVVPAVPDPYTPHGAERATYAIVAYDLGASDFVLTFPEFPHAGWMLGDGSGRCGWLTSPDEWRMKSNEIDE